MAAAYDIPVVPHGSGPYSFQAIMSFSNSDFCEYIVSIVFTLFASIRDLLLVPSPSPLSPSPSPLPPPWLCPSDDINPDSNADAAQANSPDGESIAPSFGNLFLNEPLPVNGIIDLGDEPGFGLELNPEAELVPYSSFFTVSKGLGSAGETEDAGKGANGVVADIL
jgi:L-rhamnonate dehydratase